MGAAGTLKLFSDALVVSTEASGSAYTRDMNSPELDNDKVPSFVSKLFTPRLSSSADFAYSAGIQLRLARMTLKTGTRYIGPGYTSLGSHHCSRIFENSPGGRTFVIRSGQQPPR